MSTLSEPAGTPEQETRGLSSSLLGVPNLFDPAYLRTQLLDLNPTYLRMQNAELREALASRDEDVKRLEVMV